MKLSDAEALRQIIMEEIFDQRTALKILGHLDNIREDIELSKVSVTDREERLQDRLMSIEIDHQSVLSLLHRMAGCVDKILHNPYTHERIQTHFVDEPEKVMADYFKFVQK